MRVNAGLIHRHQLVWGLFFATILTAWALLFLMQPELDLPGGWQEIGADYLASLCQANAGTAGFPAAFAMWALMALAMMAPTTVPSLRTYLDLTHTRAANSSGFAALFTGYFSVWIGFSVLGAGAQVLLAEQGLIDPLGRSTAAYLNAALLALAGLYQFSRLKDACLTSCQSPMMFFMSHWQPGTSGALHMGLRLGATCLGCCWALMLLAFVAGTMNLAFMGLAMLLMTFEKLPSIGRFITIPVGIALLAGSVLTVFIALTMNL